MIALMQRVWKSRKAAGQEEENNSEEGSERLKHKTLA